MNYTIVYQDDYLAHHGIKGMKWGVRRYQNEDGTLTAAGKARYGVESAAGRVKTGVSNIRKNYRETQDKRYEKNMAKFTKRYESYRDLSKHPDLFVSDYGTRAKNNMLKSYSGLAKQTEKRYGKADDFKKKSKGVYENVKTGKQITLAQMNLLRTKKTRDQKRQVAIGLAAYAAIDTAFRNKELIMDAWKNRPIKSDWEFTDQLRLPSHR